MVVGAEDETDSAVTRVDWLAGSEPVVGAAPTPDASISASSFSQFSGLLTASMRPRNLQRKSKLKKFWGAKIEVKRDLEMWETAKGD